MEHDDRAHFLALVYPNGYIFSFQFMIKYSKLYSRFSGGSYIQIRRTHMKKKGRLLAIAGMACLTAMTLSGCKKVTAVSLITDAVKNVEKVDSLEGTMDIGMEMGIAQSGISMGLNIDASLDMEAMRDPNIYHMDGNIGMDLMNLSVDLETYGETKGEETTIYMNVGDEWQKQIVNTDEGEDTELFLNLNHFLSDDHTLTLAEKTEKVNEKEAYVITTTLNGEDFNEAMDSFTEFMDEDLMGGMDFSDLTMNVTLKIYKDSHLPAAIIMEMDGDNAAVFEEDGAEVSLKQIRYEIYDLDYNNVDEIKIPKEALNAEESNDSEGLLEDSINELEDSSDDSYVQELLQDENGNYLLMDYGEEKQVPVATPKGFTISEYADSNYLCFDSTKDSDDAYAGMYYGLTELSDYYTEEDLLDSFSSQQEYYTEEDDYHDIKYEDVKTIKVGDYTVKYASLSYQYSDSIWEKDYYAWTVLDDNYAVECCLTETVYEKGLSIIDESTIKAAFEALQ